MALETEIAEQNHYLLHHVSTTASTTSTPSPSNTGTARFLAGQRDPPCFAVATDVHDWLLQVDRVGECNHWDDAEKLLNVVFYVKDTAQVWFDNLEGEIPKWGTFKSLLVQSFGKGAARKSTDISKLSVRQQGYGESFTSYMEDVLALWRRVGPHMSQGDKLDHVLKGLSPTLFVFVAAKEYNSVLDLANDYTRMAEFRKKRIFDDASPRNPVRMSDDGTGLSSYQALAQLIRKIVREERSGLTVGTVNDTVDANNSNGDPKEATGKVISNIVKTELERSATTMPSSRSYASVCVSAPATVTPLDVGAQAQSWWTPS